MKSVNNLLDEYPDFTFAVVCASIYRYLANYHIYSVFSGLGRTGIASGVTRTMPEAGVWSAVECAYILRSGEPMPVLQYVHLDVFTDQPLTGNQLAVFLDAAGIDEQRMQRIAKELALPETTFVLPPEAIRT